ncbi:hypothetical protein [uncultured Pedobacter sp.]|nr:hypothetical protein [uncultured Pedobacter sp.]
MRDLNKEEMLEINGGSVDKKKERSGGAGILDTISYAFNSFAGMVSGWF